MPTLRTLLPFAVVLFLAACATPTEKPAMPTPADASGCPDDLAARVGQEVTLTGTQSRTKQPMLCGVLIDGVDEDADVEVEATGTLERFEVAPPEGEVQVTSLGPGTYYRLVDPRTGQVVKPRRRAISP
jgi:hypothetical protein